MSHEQSPDGHYPPSKKQRLDGGTHRSFYSHPPPGKRPQSLQGHSKQRDSNGHPNSQNVLQVKLPEPTPPLPPIADEYAKNVFTHQSVVGVKENHSDHASYERLELLGDAYIEVMASRLLWNQFKDLPTGRLSQIRQELVKNETLAQYSVMYGFDRRLKKSEASMSAMSGTVWTKVKGDVFEAYVAALVLSDPIKGFEMAEDWMHQIWMPTLHGVQPEKPMTKGKEELAKLIMAKGIKISYVDERPVVVDKKGGIQTYFIGVYLNGWGWENQHLGSGKGLSKVVAGNEAAEAAMKNHPLIDQIVKKRTEYFEARKKAEEEAASAFAT